MGKGILFQNELMLNDVEFRVLKSVLFIELYKIW